MDTIKELGALALGSRLKRLSDLLMRDMGDLYAAVGIPFEPRWFTVFYLLKEHGPLPVMDIAKALGITHPAVIQITDDLKRKGLVTSRHDLHDARVRRIGLSDKGRALLPRLEPLWEDIRASVNELVRAIGHDVIDTIERIEHEFAQKDVRTRVLERQKQRQRDGVEILGYQPKWREHFRTLNQEWLKKYFTLEPEDDFLLNDPERSILKRGGFIFFARLDGEIVGTCALLKHGESEFELAKMGVTEEAQGRQAGRKLAEAAIAKAREEGAKSVVLETSSKLGPALQLYKSLGFRNFRPKTPSKFSRTDTFMRLELNS